VKWVQFKKARITTYLNERRDPMSSKKPAPSSRATKSDDQAKQPRLPAPAPQAALRNAWWSIRNLVFIALFGLALLRAFVTLRQPGSDTVQNSAQIPTSPTASASVLEAVVQPLPPLVFVRQGNIWRSDGTTTPPKQLTNLGSFSYGDQPAVSAADGKIAFVAISLPPSEAPGADPLVSTLTYALMVMNADGSDQRVILEYDKGEIALPYWTADGQGLFATTVTARATPDKYERTQDIQGVRLALGDEEPQIVVEDSIGLTSAPNGALLTYITVPSPDGTPALMISAPDGSNARKVLAKASFQSLYAPRFSPDGTRIVFSGAGGPATDEQGNPIGLHTPSILERALRMLEPPSVQAHGDAWGVWTVNQDGTGLRLLTTLYHGAPTASFSPDGGQIAVMDGSGIYVMQADGSQILQIDFQGDSGGLVWTN
jgi:hypothetical protein